MDNDMTHKNLNIPLSHKGNGVYETGMIPVELPAGAEFTIEIKDNVLIDIGVKEKECLI